MEEGISKRKKEKEEESDEADADTKKPKSDTAVNDSRTKDIIPLKDVEISGKCIAYWMCREHRVHDNWALLKAQELSVKFSLPLVVFACLVPKHLGGLRQFMFMIQGLQQVQTELQKLGIPLYIAEGEPDQEIPALVSKYSVGSLVTDFSPLKESRNWVQSVASNIKIPFLQVDAHNVVPCWVASNKQEYSARTFRLKMQKILSDYLTPFPVLKSNVANWEDSGASPVNWEKIVERNKAHIDLSVPEVTWIKGGELEAKKTLEQFLTEKMKIYSAERNDPAEDALSNLSPFLRFGHICSQTAILEATKHKKSHKEAYDAFFDEIIIRKELADNYCYYNPNYDNFEGFPDWAKQTLKLHEADRREHLYTEEELELGKTQDQLWNACHLEMVNTGKMHGYMRMYWAKKNSGVDRKPGSCL